MVGYESSYKFEWQAQSNTYPLKHMQQNNNNNNNNKNLIHLHYKKAKERINLLFRNGQILFCISFVWSLCKEFYIFDQAMVSNSRHLEEMSN